MIVVPTVMDATSSWLVESASQITADAKSHEEDSALTPEEAKNLTGELRVSCTALVFFLLLVGSVYPTISLILLTRPSAKAGCAQHAAKRSGSRPQSGGEASY